MNLSDEMIAKLKNIAKQRTIFDDDPDAEIGDYTGYHVDDAYFRGESDGAVATARMILAELRVDWM